MAALVLSIPNTNAGQVALAHLKSSGPNLFSGEYRQSLSERLEGTAAGQRLTGLYETFHLFVVPDHAELVALAAILNFHSFPEDGPLSHGHVSGAEINVEFRLSATLGAPITLDSQNHATYRTILNADAAVSDGITGKGVRVAVVDSGATGIALHDFYDVQNSANQHRGVSGMFDNHGHGTAMATIISDIAPEADVIAVRIVDQDRATLWEAMAGTALAAEDCHADIINLSLGFPDFGRSPCPWCGSLAHVRSLAFEKLLTSLADAHPDRVIYVAAAGNDWITTRFDYPAAYLNMLAVGSVKSNESRSTFSNYGTKNHPGYLMAPGGEIDQQTLTVTEAVGSGTHAPFAGTSASAAYASGILALLKSQSRYQAKPRKDFVADVLRNHCKLPANATASEYGSGILFYDSPPGPVSDYYDVSAGKAVELFPNFTLSPHGKND